MRLQGAEAQYSKMRDDMEERLLKAARAFLVFKAVEELGEILVYRPSSQDIEDEKFELEFSFYVGSQEGLDKILAAAKKVSEIADAIGEEITDFSSAEETAKKETPQTEAAKAVPAKPQVKAPEKKSGTPAKKANVGKPATNRTERQRFILSSIKKNPLITGKEMSETLSVTQRTVERDLAAMQKAGIIRHEGKVNAGVWVVLENTQNKD